VRTRNILYIVSISALLMTSVCCYFMIDWEEVEEYNEMYSPTDGCCPPEPPYGSEQFIMIICFIIVVILTMVCILENITGRMGK